MALTMAIAALALCVTNPVVGKQKRKARLRVESIPSGALVSVRETSESSEGTYRVVAGETPLTKVFDFGKQRSAWLQLQKRGFKLKVIEVSPSTDRVVVKLDPIEGVAGAEPESSVPIRRIAVLDPDLEVKIPHPAYKPYTSSVVLKVSIRDSSGELLFTQTAAGSGQTSKGMMSGFSAKRIAGEVVKLAIVDAATQTFEGLLDAEDLRELKAEPKEPAEPAAPKS